MQLIKLKHAFGVAENVNWEAIYQWILSEWRKFDENQSLKRRNYKDKMKLVKSRQNPSVSYFEKKIWNIVNQLFHA